MIISPTQLLVVLIVALVIALGQTVVYLRYKRRLRQWLRSQADRSRTIAEADRACDLDRERLMRVQRELEDEQIVAQRAYDDRLRLLQQEWQDEAYRNIKESESSHDH